MWKKLFAVSLVVAMMLVPASCVGKTPDAQQIVDSALEAMGTVKTYQFDMDMNVDMAGQASGEPYEGSITLGSSGTVDLGNMALKMNLAMDISVAGESSIGMDAEMYLVNDTEYIKAGIMGLGGTWLKQEMPPGFREKMGQAKPQTELLELAQVEVVGSEVVNGIDCYVLKLDTNLEQLWTLAMQESAVAGEEVLPAIDEEKLKSLFKDLLVKQWIAKDTYFLTKAQIDMSMVLTPEDMGGTEEEGSMTMDMTINLEMYDYNQPVDIVLPAEAQNASVAFPV